MAKQINIPSRIVVFEKAAAVYNSCITLDQLKAARRYHKLYIDLYDGWNNEYTR